MVWRLHRGDCLDMMADLEADSVDALVCDPPYGLGKPPPIEDVLRAWLAGDDYTVSGGGFMGRKWDAFVPGPHFWRLAYRAMKPGAHGVVFAGQRTIDVMGIALRLAGFEVRDLVGWQYWSGFPKSHDVSKAIDRAAGASTGRRVRSGR
jgi:site-specific DNA-methyltransferase (adenine-specific)